MATFSATGIADTNTASGASPVVAKKVLSLLSKAKYEAPKVVSFVVDDIKAHTELPLAGNI